MTDMLSVEAARAAVLERIQNLGTERVSIFDALHRHLAIDVAALADNPPHDNSAMDGYAVRCQDIANASASTPTRLKVIEDIPAGTVPQHVVGSGQASRIMTGAPVPEGADAVIRVEDTRSDGDDVEILEPAEEVGENIRPRGEDMRAGETLIARGTRIGPGEIGVLATAQHAFVAVARRPRIAILSSGDELVEVGEPLRAGQIINSNTPALAAMARACGAEPVILPIARDTEDAIRDSIVSALACDFVVSSGGVSVGEYDYVKKVLTDLGAEQILWRVAMKPGKPLFFCILQDTPYFGLPGNPVSSLVSFLQFVRPAIGKASGLPSANWELPTSVATMEHDIYNRGDRRSFLRARLRLSRAGHLVASTAHRAQGSHMITSMLGANGLVVLAPKQRVTAGDSVTVQLVGDLIGDSELDAPDGHD